MPRMLDRKTANGEIASGFLTCLGPLLGTGSFDDGAEDRRFRRLVGTNSRLGAELVHCWSEMQAEVGNETLQILVQPAEAAGARITNVQHALTRCRKRKRYQALDADIRALAADEPRRRAWMNCDRFSTVWVTCFYNLDVPVTNGEFTEISCR